MDLGAGERRRYATSPRCEPPDDMDDDLLFDMDYDIESDRRRRSASADSFRSCHNRSGVGLSVERFYDGEEAQLDEAEEAGPDMGVARVRSFKLRQEEWYGSLPGHHNSRHRRNIPGHREAPAPRHPASSQHPAHHAQFQPPVAFSVPGVTCQASWEEDSPGLASPEYSSSVSSVEEATEYGGQEARRKVFNHLDIEDGNSVSKSPRFLPKFLRASFSKLLKDKPKAEDRMLGVRRERDGYLRTWTVSTPVSRSPSINFDTGDHEVIHIPEPSSHVSATCTSHVSPEHSPTTGQFVAECLAKGLPIIPFNYSTAEILEKRRQSQRRKPAEILVSSERSEPQSPVERTPAPEWSEAEGADMAEDKSLEGLLTLARREMEQEAQLRKISGITGYAANNSRALQRRRSSVSEYVKSQDEEEEETGGPRVKRQNSRRRIRKHVLRQESYEDRMSPQFYFNHHEVLGGAPGCRTNAHARRAASLDQYLDMNCPQKDFV